ncbi:MAG: hypothetical protein HYZ83_03965 [Candidatus Omnitrophica bacterium]|nr:hypothetical protein [Candidatus Omnitrophota bacterium]
MTVVEISSRPLRVIYSLATHCFKPMQILRILKPRIYLGYINVLKEPSILNYLSNESFFKSQKANGPNTLWSTMAIYSIVGFIINFFKYKQPPPINLIHDPKSMSNKQRNNTYNFLKNEICKWFDKFTEGKVKPSILGMEEGKKKSVGIKIADFVAREFIRNGEMNLKTIASLTIQDLSKYIAQNPTELSF